MKVHATSCMPIILWDWGYTKEDLASYEGRHLQAFNDSATCPCNTKELPIPIGDRKGKRTLNVFFLVIPCGRFYNCILRRHFLATLDAIASNIHHKMKYHNYFMKRVMIVADLRGACLKDEMILNKPRATIFAIGKKVKETSCPHHWHSRSWRARRWNHDWWRAQLPNGN